MATTFEKKALLTGIGNGFFQVMKTEETPTTAPVYDEKVFEVPSLDKLKTKLEYKSKDIYLSSTLICTALSTSIYIRKVRITSALTIPSCSKSRKSSTSRSRLLTIYR